MIRRSTATSSVVRAADSRCAAQEGRGHGRDFATPLRRKSRRGRRRRALTRYSPQWMEYPQLGARFEVRGTLGTGGAGTVYRAYDSQLQREVALKHLRQASGRDLYRFKREFRALAAIVHPNLVTLHELHATEGDWYFTMELVEGVSFIDWVRPSRTMSGPARTRAAIIASPVHEVRLRGALVQLVDALIAQHTPGKQ